LAVAAADPGGVRVRARQLASFTLVALGAIYVAWLGFRVQTMGDYPTMFAHPMNALLGGHLGAFFGQLPTDGAGGSVLLRAPGTLVGKLLVGTQLARFRFGALECVLAAGGLGLWLARGMRERGRTALAGAAVVGLCVLTPGILDAIFFGHPEEPLGATLCVAAVLLAARDRTTLAGVALGLAIINKPWGAFAIAPALLAAPRGRITLSLVAGSIVAVWSALAYAVAPQHFVHSLSAISVVAHPQELWWPLAHLRRPDGVTPAYFLPSLIADHARELAVAMMLPLSVPLARRERPTVDQCLALLALLLLVRCLLDPSSHIYYHVPFVIALVAWEAHARTASVPAISLLAVGLLFLAFHTIAGTGSLAAQFVAYVALTVPLVAVLLRPAFGCDSRVSSIVDDRHRGRQQLLGRLASGA
jgi:hypothetical protein